MRFGVLGPVAVWTADGEPVRVPELKVRALLAALLADPGRPVSTDRLVDGLWPDRLPTNPTGALQAKVSQLRRALADAGPAGRDLVVFQPPGYLLRIPADAVDAGRFADLVARSRTTPDPGTRTALLTEALALWRGPAYADFADEPFVRAAREHLDEQWLLAIEDRAEALLALGEHAPLIGELGELVRRHPLRERLHAGYLRALYQAGRQSEALADYRRLRDRLAEELGLEPGPELNRLHAAILRHDPALLAPPRATAIARPQLPAPLTELVGRTEAVREVSTLLASNRLVTLTGAGGVGKTRLAVAVAARVAATLADGVWLVELAGLVPCDELVRLVEVVAGVLGIGDETSGQRGSGGGPADPVGRLAGALRDRRVLLVLDNCEHVVGSVAELAERLLRAAPEVRILATSQEPLRCAGEVRWGVPPLALPDPATGTDPGALLRSSAVRLFVARAAAAAPGFALTPANADAVGAICRRLDGIPLALELAASRVRVLGVHELVARLDDRFHLLATGHRGAPARQQTLRAMVDWSWELLTEAERVVLRRLGVPADGCTLDAAETICAGAGVRPSEVLDLLARLVDRSLVVVDDPGTGAPPRYRLLESVAAYCGDRLREAGESNGVRQRHALYYVGFAERAEPVLRGPAQREWLERLDQETANLRTALDATTRQGAADLALRLVNALGWYWFLRGRLSEGHRWAGLALAVAGEVSTVPRTRAETWQAALAILIGDGNDLPGRAERALKRYADVDDPAGQAMAEWLLSYALIGSGDLAARADGVDRALAGFRAGHDRWGVAAALTSRAAQARPLGDLTASRRDAERGLTLFRELGDRWGQLKAIEVLCSLAEIAGEYHEADRLHRDGLRMAEELGLWIEVSYQLSGLGRIALLRGDHVRADAYHLRAMRLAAERSHRRGEQFAEIGLGLAARRQGRLDVAEAHLHRWLDWCRQVDGDLGVALIVAELGFIAEQRGDAEAALTLHLEGLDAARTSGDPRSIALALEGLAGARAMTGHHEQAARWLGTAASARDSVGAPLPPAERGDVDRIRSVVRTALGDERFSTEYDHGRLQGLDTLANWPVGVVPGR
ncbi:BTAD domain-containing putative transcriptional regulator [Micromonospora sp. NPDC004704]